MARMEEKEYILRLVNKSNKREKIITITKKGQQKLIEVFSHIDHPEKP
jgi:DNA-binding MarR family transcriptional regulator